MERVNLERPHNIYDFAYGLSGNLIVNLIFYKESDDILYLKFAEEYTKKIITSAIKKDDMLVWEDSEGDCYSGFTRGCSGIVYSLLLLYLQRKDKETLSLAVSALESDLSRLLVNENGFLSINSKPIGVKPPVYSPYIHNGIAGIGCVLIRQGFSFAKKHLNLSMMLSNKIFPFMKRKFVPTKMDVGCFRNIDFFCQMICRNIYRIYFN
ncbi:lanthionine synthetase LanC family protein [Treponema denticola]|uniref:lanthionine synthetase LanC family protein n=1 Tax=Treponema denticola TaxID=158 RepID=UPI0002B56233|nr:lanthionine synthetase LanC family protein [Treponema denticola]EMB45400.1 hypothetical protein HMPREF9730_01220 [Treponema denticola AL-2]